MSFQITNRWTGSVQFQCELTAEIADNSHSLRLGFAVVAAVKSGADLSGAVLSDAVLRGADLSGADLSGADLSGADLRGAVLSDADLSDAVLSDAVLRGADLSGAVLSDADLSGAVLRDAVLRGAVLSGGWIPRVPDIHKAVFDAASREGALDMSAWHNECGTTHCRAGWVVTLAGDAGRVLEECWGTPAAAAAIYMASDPTLDRIPDFYANNETALADMKRLAEESV